MSWWQKLFGKNGTDRAPEGPVVDLTWLLSRFEEQDKRLEELARLVEATRKKVYRGGKGGSDVEETEPQPVPAVAPHWPSPYDQVKT